MASETRIIPDVYFPDEDQELQTSSVEGEGGRGQGGGLPGRKTVDLTPEGFIPIHKLTLEDLPEPIRTQEFLQYILDVSTLVVRVNNNGLSDLRPEDDEFKIAKRKSLTGSGILMGGGSVLIHTNRHVLFNEEELEKSTFDVFYDYHFEDTDDQKKLFKRCVRKNGINFHGKFSKDDIVIAAYDVKDDMTAHIKAHCLVDVFKCKLHLARVYNKPFVACLISHPLGQPKHVSFGEMVHYDMPSKTVYHTAPSKPGSSGGRVIVFSMCLLPVPILHVGTDLLDGKKYKYARIHHLNSSLLDMFDSLNLFLKKGNKSRSKQETTSKEVSGRASASVEIASLTAFVPIFGAFLLHLAETRPEELDATVLTPCKAFLTDDPLTSNQLKQSVKKAIQKVAQVVSSISPFSSSNLDDTSDLDSLLKSQGQCYCQSIVKMMEKGVKLVDGTVTECFLSPYTAAAKMSSDGDVTWPWLRGSSADLEKHDDMEGCLLQKCLKFSDGDIVPVLLLLLIAKANVDVKHLHIQSNDSSSTIMERNYDNQGKTVRKQSKQEPRLEENTEKGHSETRHSPPLAEEKNVSSSAAAIGTDWVGLAVEILRVIHFVFSDKSLSFAIRLGIRPQNVTSEQEENEDISKLYSRCLAVTEHAVQHERQIHADTVHSGQDDSQVKWCKCGRPGREEVAKAPSILSSIIRAHLRVEQQSHNYNDDDLGLFGIELEENKSSKDFFILIEKLQQFASDKSLPQATTVLTYLDMEGSFPRGRHSLMLSLASEEALLYNFCLTARQICKRFHSWHFAFPVSVFGRPGNWPGNVTPPEVQRSVWKLIQDAIMASGFRPALLAALEKDAERREKLIDLYVDMKQLKWQGRIQPHLFGMFMAVSRKFMLDHLHSTLPFIDPTHYFVWYATYLVCPKILTSQSPKSQQCPLM